MRLIHIELRRLHFTIELVVGGRGGGKSKDNNMQIRVLLT